MSEWPEEPTVREKLAAPTGETEIHRTTAVVATTAVSPFERMRARIRGCPFVIRMSERERRDPVVPDVRDVKVAVRDLGVEHVIEGPGSDVGSLELDDLRAVGRHLDHPAVARVRDPHVAVWGHADPPGKLELRAPRRGGERGPGTARHPRVQLTPLDPVVLRVGDP